MKVILLTPYAGFSLQAAFPVQPFDLLIHLLHLPKAPSEPIGVDPSYGAGSSQLIIGLHQHRPCAPAGRMYCGHDAGSSPSCHHNIIAFRFNIFRHRLCRCLYGGGIICVRFIASQGKSSQKHFRIFLFLRHKLLQKSPFA